MTINWLSYFNSFGCESPFVSHSQSRGSGGNKKKIPAAKRKRLRQLQRKARRINRGKK